jgi:hypothetical protein
MTAPTGEVERVAAALEDLIHDAPEPEIERVLTESLALLRSLARDAARLELALATERGKLEKADAVADSWARDAARYRWLREDPWRLKQSRDGAFDQMCTGIPKSGPECLDAAIDAAIEAAGRTEGEAP